MSVYKTNRNNDQPPKHANKSVKIRYICLLPPNPRLIFAEASTHLQPTVDLGDSPPPPPPPRPSANEDLLQMKTIDFGDQATRYVGPVPVNAPEWRDEPTRRAPGARAQADIFAEHTGSQGTLFSTVHVENERKRKSPLTAHTPEGSPKKKARLIHGGSFATSFLSQHSLSQSEAKDGKGKRIGVDFSPASEGGALPSKLAFIQEGSTTLRKKIYAYAFKPPSTSELLSSMFDLGLETQIHRDPYYSKAEDAPERAREYGGLKFRLQGGTGVGSLEEWASALHGTSNDLSPSRRMPPARRAGLDGSGILGWEHSSVPPSRRQAEEWLRKCSEEDDAKLKRERQMKMQSQVDDAATDF